LKPNGASWTQTDTPISGYECLSIRYGSGNFLGISGTSLVGHLFKLVNGSPVEVPFDNDFLRVYYNGPAPSPAYAYAQGALTAAMLPLNVGGKQYIVLASIKLGDVYEIKNDDSVSPSSQGAAGGRNTNAP